MIINFNNEFLTAFKDVFKGRTDAVPFRFPKGGYSPITSRRYNQVSGGYSYGAAATNKRLPLDDEMIIDHFKGHNLIGVYPLLDDNVCYFIASDFDNHDPNDETATRDPYQDICQFCAAAKTYGIPVYVLKSQSGNGYHVYIFFRDENGPIQVPAYEARLLAEFLVLEANVPGSTSSFDRFFPNQDVLPEQKDPNKPPIGNLIGLPFNGDRIENNNTVFLDPATSYTEPYQDQLHILKNIKGVSRTMLAAQITMNGLKNLRRKSSTTVSVVKSETSEDTKKKICKCDFIRKLWEGKDNPDILRHQQLQCAMSNMLFLKNGIDLCHELASHYKKYDAAEIDQRIKQLQRFGPHTCESIRRYQKEQASWSKTQFCNKDCCVGAPVKLVNVFEEISKKNSDDQMNVMIEQILDSHTVAYLIHMYLSGKMDTEENRITRIDSILRCIIKIIVPESPIQSDERNKHIYAMKRYLLSIENRMKILEQIICAYDSMPGMMNYDRLEQIFSDKKIIKYIRDTRSPYHRDEETFVEDAITQLSKFDEFCRMQYNCMEVTRFFNREQVSIGHDIEMYKKIGKSIHEHLIDMPSDEGSIVDYELSRDNRDRIVGILTELVDNEYDVGYSFLSEFNRGTLHILAAPFSNLKSALMLNICRNFIVYNHEKLKEFSGDMIPTILYLTAEDTLGNTLLRLAGVIENDSKNNLKQTPEVAADIFANFQHRYGVNICLKRVHEFDSIYIEACLKELIRRGRKPVLIIIDYIDEMESTKKTEKDYDKQGQCTKESRNIAIDHDSPVLTATQTNKEGFNLKKEMDVNALADSVRKGTKADYLYFQRFNESPDDRVPDQNQCLNFKIKKFKGKDGPPEKNVDMIFDTVSYRITEKSKDPRYTKGVSYPTDWNESFKNKNMF